MADLNVYTDDDVQAACRKACPCGSDAHDPSQYQECAWALTCTRLVLAAVAPAIAARALREFAEPLLEDAVASDAHCPDGMCGKCTQGNIAQLAILRADELEATR